MSIPWPRCGSETPHPPHPLGGWGTQECPGWKPEQQLVRHLVTSVHEYLREHYPLTGPPYYGDLPPGLRLEMHPSVRQALMQDADLAEPGWPASSHSLDYWLPVPVKTTTDLRHGRWRLVIVTENVLLSSDS